MNEYFKDDIFMYVCPKRYSCMNSYATHYSYTQPIKI